MTRAPGLYRGRAASLGVSASSTAGGQSGETPDRKATAAQEPASQLPGANGRADQ